MANPLMGMLQKTPEQQIAESYIEQIGRGDRTAIDPLATFLRGQEETAPLQDRYQAIQQAQTAGQVANLPESRAAAASALEQKLAPIRLQGEYGVAKEQAASQGRIGAAQALAQQRAQQTRGTQAGQLQRQRNSMLQQQAAAARKDPGGLLYRIFGYGESPDARANAILAQQQFNVDGGQQDQGAGPDPAAVAQALISQGYDPAEVDIQGLMADPQAMAQLGF